MFSLMSNHVKHDLMQVFSDMFLLCCSPYFSCDVMAHDDGVVYSLI